MTDANEIAFQLESFASILRSALDDGAAVVAYGEQPDCAPHKALVIHHAGENGAEEYLYPDCLQETLDWLKTLPKEPPA